MVTLTIVKTTTSKVAYENGNNSKKQHHYHQQQLKYEKELQRLVNAKRL